MTEKEAYNRDWYLGEPIWAVIHKYYDIPEQDVYGIMPVKVHKVTVESVSRSSSGGNNLLMVKFKVCNSKCKNPVCEDEYLSINQYTENGQTKYTIGGLAVESKFIDKESADNEFIRQTEAFKQHLISCKDSVIQMIKTNNQKIKDDEREIKKLEKENERLLKNVYKISQQITDYSH